MNEYAVWQVEAIVALGHRVVCLASRSLSAKLIQRNVDCEIIPLHEKTKHSNKLRRAFAYITNIKKNVSLLNETIDRQSIHCVVFTSFSEYFSPLWVWKLRRRHASGTRFGVIAHDPIRDFIVGPAWWHRWSVSLAYSFVDVAFVHDDLKVDTGTPERNIRTTVIPHGQYRVPAAQTESNRKELRGEFGIPGDATVLLSFGHIRDGKNLNLVIESLSEFPKVHLLVAGSLQSSAQKPIEFYQSLSRKLGLNDRCHWHTSFISENSVWKYFEVSDIGLVTYSSDFRSASGVLNTISQFQLPVLASSGKGPLKELVEEFNLGIWVEPDSVLELRMGLQQLLGNRPHADWQAYVAKNSWDANARIVMDSMATASLIAE